MIQMNLFQKQRLIDTENKLKVTKRERKLVGGILEGQYSHDHTTV